MSKVFFRYGAMNSGKSTLLLQVAYNYEERGMKVYLIKPDIDTKGENKVVSRLGVSREVDLMLNTTDEIPEIKNVDCILVDEAQFLSRKQVDQLYVISKIEQIPVICYGLRADFMGNGFPGSIRLLEIADELEEMKTICKCGTKATFNGRKIDGEFVFEGEQVLIDDKVNVEYESLCGKCYVLKKGRV